MSKLEYILTWLAVLLLVGGLFKVLSFLFNYQPVYPVERENEMKEIQLTKGKVALVDDEDFDYLNQFNWLVSPKGRARRRLLRKGKEKSIWMHRLIMNCPDNMQVDHKNGNPLDNRKENLRICTPAQNMRNIQKRKSNTSGYKGVVWDKNRNKWKAQIQVDYKGKAIGRFDDIKEAAMAYNKAALRYHGEFARLNVIE